MIKRPAFLLRLTGVMGFIWIPVVLHFRVIKDAFLRRSLLVALPFLTVMLFMGVLAEFRIFGELIPLVHAAFLIVLREVYIGRHLPGQEHPA